MTAPMTDDTKALDTPERIAEAGERIYAERHKARLEAESRGYFAAINVLTGEVYVAQFPEQALEKARKAAPNGVFHLIRVGAPGTFKVSSGSRHVFWSRAFRQPR